MIGSDTPLEERERRYLSNVISALENEAFVDQLNEDHFDDLDANDESREDWEEFMRRMGNAICSASQSPMNTVVPVGRSSRQCWPSRRSDTVERSFTPTRPH